MKSNFLKPTFVLLIIGILISSCKKDEPIQDDPVVENSVFIKSVNTNQTPIIVYTYNTNNAVIKKQMSYQGTQLETSYTYTNSKISNETTKQGNAIVSQYGYTYNTDNQLTRCDIIGVNESYWTFHYTDGKIDEAIQHIGNGESRKMSFSYTGENITEAKEFMNFGGVWEQDSRMTFEYDTQNNPFRLLEIPFSEILDEFANQVSANNATRVQSYDANNVLNYDLQYSYTYNSQNYPTVVTETEGGQSTEYTLIY